MIEPNIQNRYKIYPYRSHLSLSGKSSCTRIFHNYEEVQVSFAYRTRKSVLEINIDVCVSWLLFL